MNEMAAQGVAERIHRAHHTAVCVENFERARKFYTDFLGFTLEAEIDQRDEEALGKVTGLPGAVIRWAMLALGGYRVELFKYYRPEGVATPPRQCDRGYTHMAFEVDDVDAVYERVCAAGYQTTCPPQALRGGRTKVIYLLEPEGVVTEFVEFRDAARRR